MKALIDWTTKVFHLGEYNPATLLAVAVSALILWLQPGCAGKAHSPYTNKLETAEAIGAQATEATEIAEARKVTLAVEIADARNALQSVIEKNSAEIKAIDDATTRQLAAAEDAIELADARTDESRRVVEGLAQAAGGMIPGAQPFIPWLIAGAFGVDRLRDKGVIKRLKEQRATTPITA